MKSKIEDVIEATRIVNKLAVADRLKRSSMQENGCRLWIKTCNRQGYGLISVMNKTFRAHRVAWELKKGPIPADLFVLHRCDNPKCIRVDHLFLGTQADNQKDMVEKGRQAKGDYHGSRIHPERLIRGEQHSKAKLKVQQVLEIRTRYAHGNISLRELAKEYHVSHALVGYIVKGQHWKYLKGGTSWQGLQ